jgi:hypothetical protein
MPFWSSKRSNAARTRHQSRPAKIASEHAILAYSTVATPPGTNLNFDGGNPPSYWRD